MPGHEIQDCYTMLRVMNHIITHAPPWAEDHAGAPILGILQYVIPTVSGYAAFIDPEVNSMIKKILDAWGEFLSSAESTAVLNTSSTGWFSPPALAQLTATANIGGTSYRFDEMYVCDPNATCYGFQSWDAFFTREFKGNIRPVASPEDDTIIANACESRPFTVARNVKARDAFWIKGQNYSLSDMLGNNVGDLFVGATVYQGYLDSFSYHRWHAPVSGRISKTYLLNGTYYSSPAPIDMNPPDHTVGVTISYQTYLAAMATRAVIIIEADNPDIGLLAFLAIGMVEVSTCEISVKEGEYVRKGDQLGMFHYGGSSHCLIFKKGVNLTGFPDMERKENVPVRGKLAVVMRDVQG
ncbi:hypothetical protein Asppvi_011440 [Aspergillus pseudoviridinutans]|uniref:L-tryptophan decarboxylase PsiD-like domain-containing protein n=1 Tax=Aspergillus pseudoviridinutans TaxID=1517512 RepID=A0A9P3BP68_9EURO|nr:uncharacterized protein Asppvi_011440 [Aspergillus pseudoviridinutans]GIJ92458.1 hypothetical protein Asppvi_011440 [Aspergillus pseudoviridinutans]